MSFFDNNWIFNTRIHFHLFTAALALVYVNMEYSLRRCAQVIPRFLANNGSASFRMYGFEYL